MFRIHPQVKKPFQILCAVLLIAIGVSPAVASPGPTWREATLSVLPNQSSISVSIPEGAKRVAVEVKNAKGSWVRLSTRKTGSSTTFSMKVPKSLLRRSWRAWAEVPSSLKYPVAFYRGKKAARSVASSGYGEQAMSQNSVLRMANTALASTTASSDAGTKSEATTTQEADIWKSEGTTVYFFNQLRGLQVLDLSDPAKPSLVAQLRLPAVGQDLYILPTEDGVAHAVLLARKPGDWDASEIHLVRIAEGKASVVSTIELAGAPADSRLKGSRLFVATQTWKNYSTVGSGRAILNEISIDAAGSKLSLEKSLEFSGDSSVVSAGNEWFALAVNKWSNWNASEVHLFSIAESGLQALNAAPIQTGGRVGDKFKMQVRDGVLTAISQGWQNSENEWAWWGTPVTMLENFSTDGSPLASLEIIRGEQLYATRFAGDTAYAVTFRQTDPLWVIDLKVPYAPVISGHLEVPGWSTYIEPLGDLLFSIGWDEGRVAASLFDVSDPANPTLASRVFLSDSWGGFSESLYDEKALKILPEQNLALIPFTVHSWVSEDPGHRIQILEIDSVSRTLRTRGRIEHDFEPRRAAMVGETLASISQRQLVTADISDPDQPAVLADLLLAWPVHRVIANGDYLYQISDGSTWWDSAPALRISSTVDPDTILNEIPLGSGTVRDAAIQGNRLHILRAEGLSTGFYGWMPFLRSFVSTQNVPTNPKLHLDVFDITSSPAPFLAGTSAVDLGSEQRNLETGRILFPSGNSAVVLARSTPFYWFRPTKPIPMPVADARIAFSSPSIMLPMEWAPEPEAEPAIAAVFDTAIFTATTLALDSQKTIDIGTAIAGDGIVLYACGDKLSSSLDPKAPRNHCAGLLDVSNPASPLALSPVSLSGRLLAATDLDKRGFLAWTENLSSKGEANGLDLNASDLKTSCLVSSLTIPNLGKVAAMGRKLYAISGKQIRAYEVPDSGIPKPSGTMPLDWTAESIRVLRSDLLVGGGENLLRAPLDGFPATALEFQADQGFNLDSLETIPSAIFAPSGEYGVDLLK